MSIISNNMREFWQQEARDPEAMARRIGYLVERPRVIDGLADGTLKAVSAAEGGSRFAQRFVVPETESQCWKVFFGHLIVWPTGFNGRFSESCFPLGDDPGDEAEEFSFDLMFGKVMTGHEVIAELKRLDRVGASLWAQGSYIKAHPDAQIRHRLIGIGAQRQNANGYIEFPEFSCNANHCRGVALARLGHAFNSDCRFLVSKKEV